MLDTVDFNHVQHISFTQSLLTDAVSVILSELLSYEHPPNGPGFFLLLCLCESSDYTAGVITNTTEAVSLVVPLARTTAT